MTSKISFSKLVRDEIRKLNWLLALQFLVFLLLIPFRVLLVLGASRSSEYLSWSGKTLYDIFCQNVGLGHFENTVIILGMGVICALAAFSYVHSACQLDLYHSLAVKREKLFAAKYLGGFLTFMISYAAAQLLAIPAGACYGAFSCKATVEILLAALQGSLFFLCSYSGTLIAVMLTGKLLTSILALGVLGCYVPMLCLVYMGYQAVFFYTRLSGAGVEKWIVKAIQYSSPWALCISGEMKTVPSEVIKGVTGRWPTAGGMLLVLAVTVVLTGIALLLYRGRKTEAAGQALAFRPMEAVVKLMLTIPTAALASLLAYELMDSILWETVFILLFGVLACMIMEFIYRWDIRQVLCHKAHMLVTVVAALVIFFSCRLDIMGYNTYLPKEDSIKSMAVVSRVANLDHMYLDKDGYALGYGTENYKAMLVEKEDFEDYYRLAENGVDKARAGEGDDFSENTVSVGVKYTLKSGKEVYREYYVDKEVFLEVFGKLQKNPEFVEACYPIMTWSQENIAALGKVSFYADADMAEGLNRKDADGSYSSGSIRADQEVPGPEAHDETELVNGASDSGNPAENETEEDDYDEYEYYDEYYDGPWEMAETTEGEIYNIPDDDIERLVEAYRKDLLAVSFEDGCFRDRGSYLNFELPARGSGDGDGYFVDSYFVNEEFVHTKEVLQDILKAE